MQIPGFTQTYKIWSSRVGGQEHVFSQAHPNILMFNFAMLCSTEEVTKAPRNRGSRGGREPRMNTWSHHLHAWPCLLQGRLPMPQKESLGQVFRKGSSFPPQDAAISSCLQAFNEERHHQNSPLTIACLFACWILKMTRLLIFLINVGMSDQISYCFKLVFLKVWGLCISGSCWCPVPSNQNLWGCNKLSTDFHAVSNMENVVLLFGPT